MLRHPIPFSSVRRESVGRYQQHKVFLLLGNNSKREVEKEEELIEEPEKNG